MSSSSTSTQPVTVAAGQLQFSGGVTRDSAGDQLTLADGRTGAGVTAVTFDLSDGTSVRATVESGWYMAWWPGAATATKAEVTTSSGTHGHLGPGGTDPATVPSRRALHGGLLPERLGLERRWRCQPELELGVQLRRPELGSSASLAK